MAKIHFEDTNEAYGTAWAVLKGSSGLESVASDHGVCVGMQQVMGNSRYLLFISELDGEVTVEQHQETSLDRKQLVPVYFSCVRYLVGSEAGYKAPHELEHALGALAQADMLDDLLAPHDGPTNFMDGFLSRHFDVHPAILQAVIGRS